MRERVSKKEWREGRKEGREEGRKKGKKGRGEEGEGKEGALQELTLHSALSNMDNSPLWPPFLQL